MRLEERGGSLEALTLRLTSASAEVSVSKGEGGH
jgi:hypothetical protein